MASLKQNSSGANNITLFFDRKTRHTPLQIRSKCTMVPIPFAIRTLTWKKKGNCEYSGHACTYENAYFSVLLDSYTFPIFWASFSITCQLFAAIVCHNGQSRLNLRNFMPEAPIFAFELTAKFGIWKESKSKDMYFYVFPAHSLICNKSSTSTYAIARMLYVDSPC